jgi:hypothetical protein
MQMRGRKKRLNQSKVCFMQLENCRWYLNNVFMLVNVDSVQVRREKVAEKVFDRRFYDFKSCDLQFLTFLFNCSQEDANRGKPNWEHLADDLHVLITVEDTENRAKVKLQRAVEEVQKLLVPVSSHDEVVIIGCHSNSLFFHALNSKPKVKMN